MNSRELKSGMLYATIAYLGWGFFPIYWKFLKHVPLLQILSHRVIWAFVFYTCVLIYRERKLSLFKPENKRLFLSLSAASVLLMGNWLVYIYAVNSNQVIESSLGYFINPLVNILLGVWILKERLSIWQTAATVLAGIGVLIISVDQGHIPLIALFLGISFSAYGLLKKLNPVPALKSNQFESLLMAPLAFVFLLTQPMDWVTADNRLPSFLLLAGTGFITGIPLIFFAKATQKIPYYLMGFFQFMSPSIQFLTGVLLFGEPLSQTKLFGFVFIWAAGLLLLLRSWWVSVRAPAI